MGAGVWHVDLTAPVVGGLDLGAELGVRVGPVACRATLPAITVPLIAGEWRVTATVWSEPDSSAPPPAESTRTVWLAEPGDTSTEALTLRLYRSLDGPTLARCAVRVERRTSDGWIPHGTPATAEVELGQVEACAHLPGWGANLHIYIPGDRPPGSLDPHLERMSSVGMGLVRTGIPWNVLCPESDTFDALSLAQADAFFAACARTGVMAIPIIDAHAPGWARGEQVNVPASWDSYTEFVRRCLDRWGDTFAAVLTQNEPNHEGHVGDFTPDLVVAATRAARAALASSPHAGRVKLLGPGIAYGDAAYLALLLDAGLGDLVDGIACHPYAIRFDIERPHFREPERPWGDPAGDPNHLVSGVEAVWELLQERGYDMSVWVNEFGLSTSRTGPDGTRSGLDVTAEVQAEWLATAVRQAAAIPYVESFCIYMLHDNPWKTVTARFAGVDPDDTSWHACFGLVSHDGQREKPAFRAVVEAMATATAAAAIATKR